jgi:dihydroorotase-like cyclic amidohydrolase
LSVAKLSITKLSKAMQFDTIIRGGTIATEADTFACDIGIRGEKIAALGDDLGEAGEIVDATGRLVLPGGIDSHVHVAQPSAPGIVMADDFESGTRAAAFGGNTMILPFAMQQRGESLRQVVRIITPRRTAAAMWTCRSTSSSPTPPRPCSARNSRHWCMTATPLSRCS